MLCGALLSRLVTSKRNGFVPACNGKMSLQLVLKIEPLTPKETGHDLSEAESERRIKIITLASNQVSKDTKMRLTGRDSAREQGCLRSPRSRKAEGIGPATKCER